MAWFYRGWSSLRFGLGASHGLADEIDAVGVVDEPIEDGVGVGGVADEGVPVGDGDLAGDEGGFAAVTVFEDFQQVVPGLGIEGFEAPVVDDEQLDGAEGLDASGGAAVAVAEGEIIEQLGGADV